MLLGLVLAIITAIVLASVFLPLVKSTRAAPGRGAFDRAVYRDQLQELERDIARGTLAEPDAAGARLEIERRLLGADRADAVAPAPMRASPRLAALLAILVAAGAGGVYFTLGTPGLPDQPYDARGAERAAAASNGQADLQKTVDALAAKLAANPGDGNGWLLYARSTAALGQWSKSTDAYRRALALNPDNAETAAAYGEALVMAADGIVTPAAHDAFAAVLAKDPQNGPARYYLALAEAQAGNAQAAIDGWQKLAAEMPDNAPVRAELRRRIADAASAAGIAPPPLAPPAAAPAPGPDAQQMAEAANLPPEQRTAMIQTMVDRLAERLKTEPDDLQGWLRLARAYGVMKANDKAADAYAQAARLAPDNPKIILAQAEATLAGRPLEQPIPDDIVALLRKVATLSPNEPAALWYLGLAAAQGHRADEAARYWQHLLVVLPPDAPERKTVLGALDAIKGP